MTRNHRIGRAVLARVTALAVAGPALAEKPDWAGGGHGKGHGNGQANGGNVEGAGRGSGGGPGGGVTIVSRTDVDVIRTYFVDHPVGVSSLPPGIAKNLARGKPLPPGIAKKMAPIELRRRVPVCMNGWECILAGADMLILDAVHGTIADIVRNVVR